MNRDIAGELGIMPNPHLSRTFKVSNDPRFVENMTDVVGLYLNPPERAIMDYIAEHNKAPNAIVWTAKAEMILKKVRRASATLRNVKLNEALH